MATFSTHDPRRAASAASASAAAPAPAPAPADASPKVLVACVHCNAMNRLPHARRRDDPSCARCGRPLLAGTVTELVDADFDAVVGRTGLPVLVDFWAPWCGPCKAMAPALEEAARRLKGDVLVCKLDSDRSLRLASRHALKAVPTLILFEDGRERRRHAGALAASDIVRFAQQG